MTTREPSSDVPLFHFSQVDANLRLAMRFFGEATGSGGIGARPGVEMVYSGLDYGVFNIAFLTQPVSSSRDLAAILSECGRYYRERKVRWSFWLCEDLLEPVTRRRSRDLFDSFGMRSISQAPGMLATALLPPWRPLPKIDCRPVDSADLRAAFADLTSVCFDIAYPVARAVYEPASAWQGRYEGFVGFAGGVPVSMVALVRAPTTLGIYSLGTLPEHRRRGYGEALLRAAVARKQSGTARELLALESTEAGYPLYRRMGFQDVARFTVYLTR